MCITCKDLVTLVIGAAIASLIWYRAECATATRVEQAVTQFGRRELLKAADKESLTTGRGTHSVKDVFELTWELRPNNKTHIAFELEYVRPTAKWFALGFSSHGSPFHDHWSTVPARLVIIQLDSSHAYGAFELEGEASGVPTISLGNPGLLKDMPLLAPSLGPGSNSGSASGGGRRQRVKFLQSLEDIIARSNETNLITMHWAHRIGASAQGTFGLHTKHGSWTLDLDELTRTPTGPLPPTTSSLEWPPNEPTIIIIACACASTLFLGAVVINRLGRDSRRGNQTSDTDPDGHDFYNELWRTMYPLPAKSISAQSSWSLSGSGKDSENEGKNRLETPGQDPDLPVARPVRIKNSPAELKRDHTSVSASSHSSTHLDSFEFDNPLFKQSI